MRNKVDDLHKKVAVYLCEKFENIHLGKSITIIGIIQENTR